MKTAAMRLLRPPRPLRPRGSTPLPRSRRQRGFTIIEMTVALFVTAEVILAALALFDFHNKLAHVQASSTEPPGRARFCATCGVTLRARQDWTKSRVS